jgi:hypothetical protein
LGRSNPTCLTVVEYSKIKKTKATYITVSGLLVYLLVQISVLL